MKPIHSKEDLLQEIGNGLRPRYLLFWGHTPPKDGSVSKACFSQWYEAPFQIEGNRYSTAEHYMMAAKARLFGDEVALQKILDASHPGEVKKLGRTVSNFNEDTWREERFRLVVEGNLAKFSQNEPLAQFLKNTGDRVLVEASPYDRIWGIGLAASDKHAEEPSFWKGLNLLGFALMDVRNRLRGE